LDWWINEGQAEEKKNLGRGGLSKEAEELLAFRAKYNYVLDHATASKSRSQGCASQPFVVGCDFGSTTAKAVCLSPNRDILFSCYALSRGNPIEDAKHLFQQICEFANNNPIAALGITGYGKDLLQDILGADQAVVETIAHAAAGLLF